MARTIDQIYAALIAEKANHSELDAMNSTSQTAIWRLYLYIIAVCMFVLESLWDAFKTDVETTIYNTIPGTIRWYYQKCLEFQLGDSLQWIDDRFQYLTINEDHQIIKRVAIEEKYGKLYIKVARLNNAVPEALDPTEFSAFNTYLQQVKYAGSQLVITSASADRLAMMVIVQYDPLLIDATGALLSDGTTKPVEVAIADYIAGIHFGGTFNRTKCIDAIQQAEGVIDVVMAAASIDNNNQLHWFFQNYTAESGYFAITQQSIVYNPTADVLNNLIIF